MSLAGPRLGEGPRWDLGPGVSSSKDDGKVRGLGHVEGLSIKWKGVRKVFKFINRRFGDDVWQLVENFVSRIEGLEMEDLKQSQEEEEEEEEEEDQEDQEDQEERRSCSGDGGGGRPLLLDHSLHDA